MNNIITQELYWTLKDLVNEYAEDGGSKDNQVWRYAKMKLLQYSQYNLVCPVCKTSSSLEIVPDVEQGANEHVRTIPGGWMCHYCDSSSSFTGQHLINEDNETE